MGSSGINDAVVHCGQRPRVFREKLQLPLFAVDLFDKGICSNFSRGHEAPGTKQAGAFEQGNNQVVFRRMGEQLHADTAGGGAADLIIGVFFVLGQKTKAAGKIKNQLPVLNAQVFGDAVVKRGDKPLIREFGIQNAVKFPSLIKTMPLLKIVVVITIILS